MAGLKCRCGNRCCGLSCSWLSSFLLKTNKIPALLVEVTFKRELKSALGNLSVPTWLSGSNDFGMAEPDSCFLFVITR